MQVLGVRLLRAFDRLGRRGRRGLAGGCFRLRGRSAGRRVRARRRRKQARPAGEKAKRRGADAERRFAWLKDTPLRSIVYPSPAPLIRGRLEFQAGIIVATQDAGSIETFHRAEREPMPSLSIEEIANAFLSSVSLLYSPSRWPSRRTLGRAGRREIEAAEAECRRRWGGVELSAIAEVAAWRAAYKGFGIKRTSYRSSVERLIKRVLAGQPLPRDQRAGRSLQHGLAGDRPLPRLRRPRQDVGRSRLPLLRAMATAFIDMGAEAGDDPNDPPKDGEVVYADGATCSAGGGTGARIPAPHRASRPAARC